MKMRSGVDNDDNGMKKIIVLSMFTLMLCFAHMNAQNFQLKDMVGKTWTGVSGCKGCDYIDWTITFTEKTSVHRFASKPDDGKPGIFTYNMYLSDVEPKFYDASLLGKKQSGKYVVCERKYIFNMKEREDFKYVESISLTSDRLIVRANGLTITFVAK